MGTTIRVQTDELKNVAGRMQSLKNDYDVTFNKVMSDIKNTNNDWSQAIANNFSEKINSVSNSLKAIDQDLDTGIQILTMGAVTYEEMDKALASATLQDNMREIAKKISKTSPIAPTNSADKDGAPKYNLPEYASKNTEPDANGIYGPFVYWRDGGMGSVCEWNKAGQLSCTYYTLRKLNEQGKSYPCTGGPGNGADWFRNFDRESGLPYYEGDGALNSLCNDLSLPQKNIVVSFSKAYAPGYPDVEKYGHVMLIDSIYRDQNNVVHVKFSDNYPDITTLNGTNEQQDMTLDQFLNSYHGTNGSINGIAVIGA